ncbi:MAG: hypothetical protein WCA49_05645 [Candidatus Sulfotelmatobacter sp.]
MKKLKKLAIKKVTLQNLDEPTLDDMAGGLLTATCLCPTKVTCVCPTVGRQYTCPNGTC